MGQWAWVLGSQLGPTSQKKKVVHDYSEEKWRYRTYFILLNLAQKRFYTLFLLKKAAGELHPEYLIGDKKKGELRSDPYQRTYVLCPNSWAEYTLANIVLPNTFGKFIFPRTSCEQEESEESTPNYRQLRENCWRHREIFLQTWKRTKTQTNIIPTEQQTSFVFVEKSNWRWFATNCLWIPYQLHEHRVCEQIVCKCICSFIVDIGVAPQIIPTRTFSYEEWMYL